MQSPIIEVPRWALQALNHLFEIEQKLEVHGDPGNAKRNVDRIKEAFESEKIFYENPMGRAFDQTRTDMEASIAGTSSEDLVVIEVIKPIVRCGDRRFSRVIQKGIVIVAAKMSKEA